MFGLRMRLMRKGRAEAITGPPAKVSGVSPANGATNQQLDIVITWSRPAMARTYDVYLDTVNPPVTKVSDDQTARVYVPTLALDTTYYLKINAANALGETAGDVVSFSTWGGEFAPSSLFRANEQGVWYDPSDIKLNWRRNLLTYSEQFDNVFWKKDNSSITANAAIAPDGTTTADKLIKSAVAGNFNDLYFNNIATNSYSVFSIYAKMGEHRYIYLRPSSIQQYVIVDLQTMLAVRDGNSDGLILLSLTPIDSSWCRISVIKRSEVVSWIVNIASSNTIVADYANIPAGDGTSGIYIWGAQLEKGTSATEYQKITDGVSDYYTYQPLPVLYQDAAGTIPVTAVEQPVGLMLDKSGKGNHAYQATSANRPTLSARYNVLLATETLETQSVTTQATSYKLTFTGTGSITLSGTATGTYLAGTHTITCAAGTLTLTVGGSVTKADLRPSNHGTDLPAYQRVTTSTDYDTVGFPPYLAFNGMNSSMVTNSIDFSATDKMSMWAGVRRLINTIGIISELSANTNDYTGSMMFLTGLPPNGIGAAFSASSRGTQPSDRGQWGTTPVTFTPPVTAVLMGAHSISDDLSSCRGNGVSGVNGTVDKGTGNFGNYPLYIGARNQSLHFFNGYIYSLIVRGAQSTDKQVSNAESWINKKIGKVY